MAPGESDPKRRHEISGLDNALRDPGRRAAAARQVTPQRMFDPRRPSKPNAIRLFFRSLRGTRKSSATSTASQRRIQGLVGAVANRAKAHMPDSERRRIEQLLTANECGAALEAISTAVAESGGKLDRETLGMIADLSVILGLPSETVERLK